MIPVQFVFGFDEAVELPLGDLYAIARNTMAFNEEYAMSMELPPDVIARLPSELEHVRRVGHPTLKQGFMVAKWLVILKYFNIQVTMLESDVVTIQKALRELMEEADIIKFASLIRACEELDVSPGITTEEFDEAFSLKM